jgi:hypothetical protein
MAAGRNLVEPDKQRAKRAVRGVVVQRVQTGGVRGLDDGGQATAAQVHQLLQVFQRQLRRHRGQGAHCGER